MITSLQMPSVVSLSASIKTTSCAGRKRTDRLPYPVMTRLELTVSMSQQLPTHANATHLTPEAVNDSSL